MTESRRRSPRGRTAPDGRCDTVRDRPKRVSVRTSDLVPSSIASSDEPLDCERARRVISGGSRVDLGWISGRSEALAAVRDRGVISAVISAAPP